MTTVSAGTDLHRSSSKTRQDLGHGPGNGRDEDRDGHRRDQGNGLNYTSSRSRSTPTARRATRPLLSRQRTGTPSGCRTRRMDQGHRAEARRMAADQRRCPRQDHRCQRWTTSRATVHNLTVSELHTYYVVAGATPVLVHNCNEVPDPLSLHDRGRDERNSRESGELWPSTKAARPTDAKYGDGQYFTDVKPRTGAWWPGLCTELRGEGRGTATTLQSMFVGLGVVKAPDREGVFVLNGGVLDVSNRIVGHGRGPIGP